MQIRNPISKWLGIVVALAMLGIAGVRSETAGAQSSILSGWLHVIWADPVTGSIAEPGPRYVLIDDQEQWIEITLDETRLRSLGGPLTFNRKRVTIAGVWEEAFLESWKGAGGRRPRLRVDEIQVESSLELSADAPTVTAETTPLALSGPQPWVTILCRFADSATVTPRPKSYFDSLLGGVYPGLDHYWREVSYDNINITGSVVVGWYNLPQPRSYYVYDQNGDGQVDLDFFRARNDCTAVADAEVFFPGFVGINLMFNQNLDCCAWGGSTTLTRDGQTKVYRITWIPPGGVCQSIHRRARNGAWIRAAAFVRSLHRHLRLGLGCDEWWRDMYPSRCHVWLPWGAYDFLSQRPFGGGPARAQIYCDAGKQPDHCSGTPRATSVQR